jgi:hypothetical protein
MPDALCYAPLGYGRYDLFIQLREETHGYTQYQRQVV